MIFVLMMKFVEFQAPATWHLEKSFETAQALFGFYSFMALCRRLEQSKRITELGSALLSKLFLPFFSQRASSPILITGDGNEKTCNRFGDNWDALSVMNIQWIVNTYNCYNYRKKSPDRDDSLRTGKRVQHSEIILSKSYLLQLTNWLDRDWKHSRLLDI